MIALKLSFIKLAKNKYILLLLSFLLPFVLFGVVLAQFGIYPFGSKSILISDMYSQYIEFYNRLYDVFYNGKSLFYSWEAGMGLNFLAVIAYYLASPLSILIIFFPRNHLPEAMVLMTLIKIGLSGATMYFFLSRFSLSEKFSTLFFSTFYALMTFSIAYSFDIMWLDGIYMLPLILYGVELLIKDGKYTFLIACLAITFISNFYVAFMIGIFTFLYFLVRFFSLQRKTSFLLFLKKIGLFGTSTAIAAGLSAFLILPTYLVIKANHGDPAQPQILPKIHLFNYYLKFFNGTYDSLIDGLPNIYAGLLTLLLFPLFFVSKKIKLKEKVLFLLLFSFLVYSFQNSELYFIWHGGHNPNWFPYRFSFLLSFTVIYLAFRTFVVLDKTISPYLIVLYIFNILFVLFVWKYTPNGLSNKFVIINIVLLTIYFILMYCKLHISEYKKFIHILLILAVCLDTTLNSAKIIRSLDHQFQYKPRDMYNGPSDYINMINWLKKNDHSFYRINTDPPITWNDSMMLDYKKMDSFNSQSNNDLNRFLNELGYTTSDSVFVDMGKGIVSTDSLMGFKYIISNYPIDKFGYELIHHEGNYLLYKNNNVLSLGTVLNNQNHINFQEGLDNPFEKQNLLFMGATKASPKLFVPMEPTSIQYENLTVQTEADGQKFIKNDKTKNAFIKYSFPVSGKQQLYTLLKTDGISNSNVYVNDTLPGKGYPNVYSNRVLDLGAFQNETVTVKIEVLSDEFTLKNGLFYAMDMNLFEKKVDEYRKQSLTVKSFQDTNISGDIKLNENGVLFLSIPYDSGWSAVVDGKKGKIEKIGGFLGIDLEKGNHKIDLHYVPPGFHVGLIISLCSLLLFIVLILMNFRKKRQNNIN
jgi:uncharacterized membrane protein YfhO